MLNVDLGDSRSAHSGHYRQVVLLVQLDGPAGSPHVPYLVTQ